MYRPQILGASVLMCLAGTAFGQTKVDFARDIAPILTRNCVGCHGPSQQMGGLRLDRRSFAMQPGTRRIVPGGSANSFVYLKLIGEGISGLPMPPAGPLRRDQIDLIKAWIDQGADWPDALSGDAPPPVPDAIATRLMTAIRDDDRRTVHQVLREQRDAVNRRGTGGSTALVYATLYGDVDTARLLLDHDADPNGRPADGSTPLEIASGRAGSRELVTLLLDRGAKPETAALAGAAYAGNEEVFRLLVERGADLKTAAPFGLWGAARSNCAGCFDAMVALAGQDGLNVTLAMLAPFGETPRLAALLDRGADINVRLTGVRKDLDGRTPLMLAANSQRIPIETVGMLIDRGADVNARGPRGETALDYALRNGNTAVVDLLRKSGATAGAAFAKPALTPKPADTVRSVLDRSLAVLQRSETVSKSGCISCHNDTFTIMSIAAARQNGVPLNEAAAAQQLARIESLVNAMQDEVLRGANDCGLPEAATYILVGLAAHHYRPTSATDALALCLKARQSPDGRWRTGIFDLRPPMQSTDVTLTGFTIRALQLYAPRARRAEYESSVRRAASWLARARPVTNDERVSQLLGLTWAGMNRRSQTVRTVARDLLAQQRPDGGWAQIATLTSDAYATGQSLYALRESGALSTSDAAYQRGVRFLIDTQLEDGSWYVQSRSIPFQPYFESGFPHGADQWVSAAATNWAVMALAPAHRTVRSK